MVFWKTCWCSRMRWWNEVLFVTLLSEDGLGWTKHTFRASITLSLCPSLVVTSVLFILSTAAIIGYCTVAFSSYLQLDYEDTLLRATVFPSPVLGQSPGFIYISKLHVFPHLISPQDLSDLVSRVLPCTRFFDYVSCTQFLTCVCRS
jgi:hypothetical protein